MRSTGSGPDARQSRFDRTLRAVMWMDAFLSVWTVYTCMAAAPVVAAVGLLQALRPAVVVVSIAAAVLLAAFGAITGVVLMVRMAGGDYLLPPDLRLPLPRPMRPPQGNGGRGTASAAVGQAAQASR